MYARPKIISLSATERKLLAASNKLKFKERQIWPTLPKSLLNKWIDSRPQTVPIDFNVPDAISNLRCFQAINNVTESQKRIIISAPTGTGKTIGFPTAVVQRAAQTNALFRAILIIPTRLPALSLYDTLVCTDNFMPKNFVGLFIRNYGYLDLKCQLLICTPGIARIVVENEAKLTHIFIDEAHERNPDIEFILHQTKHSFKDTQVILMSASMNDELLQKFEAYNYKGDGSILYDLNVKTNFPIIDVNARIFLNDSIKSTFDLRTSNSFSDGEVSILHRQNDDVAFEIVKILQKVMSSNFKETITGNIIVFVPGLNLMNEIKDQLMNLHGGPVYGQDYFLYRVHSSLETDEAMMKRIGIKRKIILTTNALQTGITVPNIGVVIDCCTEKKAASFDEMGIIEVKEQLVSYSSYTQRRGRGGRERASFDFYLCNPEDLDIIKNGIDDPSQNITSPLAHIMQLIRFGLPATTVLDYFDPWSEQLFESTINRLIFSGFLDENFEFTAIGKTASIIFPMLDPDLAFLLFVSMALGIEIIGVQLVALLNASCSIINNRRNSKSEFTVSKLSGFEYSEHVTLVAAFRKAMKMQGKRECKKEYSEQFLDNAICEASETMIKVMNAMASYTSHNFTKYFNDNKLLPAFYCNDLTAIECKCLIACVATAFSPKCTVYNSGLGCFTTLIGEKVHAESSDTPTKEFGVYYTLRRYSDGKITGPTTFINSKLYLLLGMITAPMLEYDEAAEKVKFPSLKIYQNNDVGGFELGINHEDYKLITEFRSQFSKFIYECMFATNEITYEADANFHNGVLNLVDEFVKAD